MSKRKAAFVEVWDLIDNGPRWVRPSEIVQVSRRDRGESDILLASGETAWYPMGRTKFVKWLAKVEG